VRVYFKGIGWIVFDPLVWDYSPIEDREKTAHATSSSALDSLLDDEKSTTGILWGLQRLYRPE
jgi:hypothetical protein